MKVQFLLVISVFTASVHQSGGVLLTAAAVGLAVGVGIGIGILIASGNEKEHKAVDTTPPNFIGQFTVCNDEQSIKDYGTIADVKPIEPFWPDPKARDRESKPETVLRPYLPEVFGDGQHEIVYEAHDNSPLRNRNICRVRFKVQVKTCEILSHPLPHYLDCPRAEEHLVLGTICRYYCAEGYKLEGSFERTCTRIGTQKEVEWTPNDAPNCRKITCPQLDDPVNGFVTCTDNSNYHSVCTYTCEEGYGLGTGLPSTLICLSSETWSANPITACKDIESPVFSDCEIQPVVHRFFIAANESASVFNWISPDATDNDGDLPHIDKPSYPQPGVHDLEATYYSLTYTATDKAGNQGTCSFLLIVSEVRCDPLPTQVGLLATCSHGTRRGSFCHFTCSDGYSLVGDNHAMCESSGPNSRRGEWSNPAPHCEEIHCDLAPVIENGQFAFGTCDTKFSSTCHYVCDEGYMITSTSVLQCTLQPGTDGAVWFGNVPACEVQTCDRPPLHGILEVSNGTLCATSTNVPVNETCSFSCTEGYFLQGASVTQCGLDGSWLQTTPVCQSISCTSLPKPMNGGIHGCPGTSQQGFGTTCTLFCDVGFKPSNNSDPLQRTCVANGQNTATGVWLEGGTIACIIVTCNPLSDPVNGEIMSCTKDGISTNVSHIQHYSTICRSSCNLGYTPQYSITRRCMQDGSWDGIDQLCQDQTDPEVTCPSDQVLYADYNQLEATFHAELWEPVQATDAGDILTAQLFKVDSNVVSGGIPTTLPEGDHTVEYRAEDNAGNQGSCSFNLDVKVTRCPPLFVPPNGEITMDSGSGSCMGGAIYGSECLVSCVLGYELSLESEDETFLSLICNRSSSTTTVGSWSNTLPSCNRIECDIPAVTHGTVSGCSISASYGDSCYFSCNDGFKTSEGLRSVTRVCQANLTFDGQDLDCDVPVTCPPLSAPDNGFVTPEICTHPDGVTYDTLCSFSCDNGYLQNGVYQKKCLNTENWNDVREVMCRDNEAPVFFPPCPLNQDYNADRGYTYASIEGLSDLEPAVSDNSGTVTLNLTSALPSDNRFPETPTRLVYSAEDPTGNLGICDITVHVNVFRCSRLTAPFHGSLLNCTADTVYGSTCSFSCNEGYDLVGSESRTCELSGSSGPASWNGTEPLCQAKTCPALTTPENAVKSGCINEPPNTEVYGTQCIFYCAYGFRGVGVSSPRCQADGTWTSNNFSCDATPCTALRVPDGGKVTPEECSSSPVFGQSCVASCTQQGYQLDPPNFSVLSCQGNGQWAPGDLTVATCKDVQNPSFSSCPRYSTFNAPRGETLANVSWNLTATDNSGVEPDVICDTEQGLIGEGDFEVRCTATDAAGNDKTCTFDVAVNVHRCRPYLLPSYAEYDGVCDMIWGAVCNITCSPGYRLTGSSKVTCEFDGSTASWNEQETPRCEVIKCDPLELPENVNINPPLCAGPDDVNGGTSCTPYCPTGTDLQGDESPVVCGKDGDWSRIVNNTCVDLTAPTLTSCPSPITVTRIEAWGVEVTFNPPTTTDSLDGSSLTVVTSPSDLAPPYNFTEDTTCSYTFIDNAGNNVTCSFDVYVQDELSPVLVSCPNDTVVHSSEQVVEVTWDPPEFVEPTGDPLDITCNYDDGMASLALDRDHLIECRATNLDNSKTTTCSFIISVKRIPCEPLEPPENGALACDGWSDGTFCSMLCNENFDIPRSRMVIPPQYVCGTSGIWGPHATVPDCSESRRGRRINLQSELFYYSGSCGTSETQQAIAQAFLNAFLSSLYSSSCTDNDECTVNNVEVRCSASGQRRRKRRSRSRHMEVDVSQSDEHVYYQQLFTKRHKRSALNFEIVIGFQVEMNFIVSEDQSDYDAAIDAEDKMISLVETLIEDGRLDLSSSVDNFTIALDEGSFTYEYVELVCTPPYTANSEVYRCVSCGRGFSYDNETQLCIECEIGTYQDTHGQFTCQQCPEGQSTLGVRSKNVSQCLDVCQPGYSSETGLAPCNQCPIGTYQDDFYATQCTSCPDNTTTQQKGSTSPLECLTFCTAGENSSTGFAPCSECPLGTYQSGIQRSTCHRCPGFTTTLQTGSTDASLCVDIDECESQPCQHDAICLDGINSFTCICQMGYTGPTCGDQILWCDSNPCLNGGSCVDGFNQFTCMCAPGYTGFLCEAAVDYCDPSPCENNATCANAPTGFDCSCPFGFGGQTCSKEIDYCVDGPCENGATCIISELSSVGYTCLCLEGYTGVICSSNIDDCKSSPCMNNGNCTDGINSFTCSCSPGFRGLTCDEDIDLCANLTCQNSGTCEDLGDRAVCACTPAYAGQFCEEVRTGCSDFPCRNGGTCTALDDTTLAFNCSCSQGYIGQTCEIKIDYCQSDPCRNGAACIDQETTYICECTTGFTGETCVEEINWCEGSPCGANASCIEDSTSFRCLCDVGYTGEVCEKQLTLCDAQDPCLNGATCSGDLITFECQCPPGYQGLICEQEIDPCSSSPCLNGATCVKDLLSYHCDCPSGFEGTDCAVERVECSSNPCEHGTCIDGVDSFECECEAGYSGVTCSEDKLCDPNPCRNGGSCENLNTRYRCNCALGFRGFTCDRQIDYCRRRPCISANTVRCENAVGQYTCVCKSGFTGSKCESEINECEMSPPPCLSGGSCINQWGTFICQCQPGFTGDICDIDTDDCLGHLCESGATCVDGINSYTCKCTEGTYGSHCQLTSTPCDNNPCYNGGVCLLNEDDGFLCECLSGYTGPTCEVNIDDCINHQCASGSTCEDQWNSYSCVCPQGLTGDLCNEEIDDCTPNPCQHGATCIDGRSSFTCTCLSGFKGKLCEIDVIECFSNPCANFGTCIEGTDRFDCICAEGYQGTTCEEFVSSCVSNPCKNNGTCTDSFMQFTCTCPPGYTGDVCETVIPDNYDLHLDNRMPSISFSADVISGYQNLTVSCWVKVQMMSSDKHLMNITMSNFHFSVQNPCSLFFFQAGQNGTSSDLTMCDGSWHHMLLVFSDSGRWSAQVDGIEIVGEDDELSHNNLSGILQLDLGDDELDQQASLSMTSINVWGGFIPEEVLSRITSECLPQLYGNIISWTDFDSHQDFLTASTTPSVCDDTDECLSLTPCHNGGTCMDKLRSYTCLCLEDYGGINCENFMDLCNNGSCENGGSCTTMNRTIHCSCPDRFLGEFCELEIINGGWSDWLPWSPCSASCEGGIRNTSRECTNPPPNQYGEPCQGEDTKEEPCNTQECPGCIQLQTPENATLDCWSKGDTKKCTIRCNSPDLSFIYPVEPEYSCSPESEYKWNHENTYNRRATLPPCKETMSPDTFEVNVNIAYPGATCESDEDQEKLKQSFKSTYMANSNDLGCKDCEFSNVQISNCGSSRKKRSTGDSPTTVSFVININSTDSNVTARESFDALDSGLDQLLENGSFSLMVSGEVIAADLNQSSGEYSITCPEGSGWSENGNCVSCPIGNFLFSLPNTSIALCTPCLLHTYQDQEGQAECIPCPSGLITNDPGADNISDCIEPCPLGHYQDVWTDPSNTTCIQCPLDTYQDEAGRESCYPCPSGYVTLELGATNISHCVAVCNAGHYVDLSNKTNPQCPLCPLNTYMDRDVHQEEECISCPPGMITIQNGSSQSTDCLEPCPLGHYKDVWTDPSNTTCIQCPLDTYQDETGRESCYPCPSGYVTLELGATNISHCVAVCNAGHYVDLSNKTNPQCPLCPLNTYMDRDVHQKEECISCPPRMITIQNGSSQSTDCLVSCIPGTYLERSSCSPCPLNTYQDQTNHREESCILCPENLVTLNERSDHLADCTDPQEPDNPIIRRQTIVIIITVISAGVVLVIFVTSVATVF